MAGRTRKINSIRHALAIITSEPVTWVYTVPVNILLAIAEPPQSRSFGGASDRTFLARNVLRLVSVAAPLDVLV